VEASHIVLSSLFLVMSLYTFSRATNASNLEIMPAQISLSDGRSKILRSVVPGAHTLYIGWRVWLLARTNVFNPGVATAIPFVILLAQAWPASAAMLYLEDVRSTREDESVIW
jgi:hypothetical protein